MEGPGSGAGAELGPGDCPSYAGGGATSTIIANTKFGQIDIHSNIPKISDYVNDKLYRVDQIKNNHI